MKKNYECLSKVDALKVEAAGGLNLVITEMELGRPRALEKVLGVLILYRT